MIPLKALRRLDQRLRREYPELIGFGIGYRRQDGRVKREFVIKLTVVKKRGRRSKDIKLLPRQVEIPVGKGRRRLTVHMHTDVEAARAWRPLRFAVMDGEAAATATCLARWREGDELRFGVVTAGHGVWARGKQLSVATRNGPQPGVVRVTSDLVTDHLDATLVELPVAGLAETELMPATPLAAVQAPLNLDETVALIGESTIDGVDIRIEQWAQANLLKGTALALHLSYTVPRVDEASVDLTNVVEAKGRAGMFVRGASGATWATAKSTVAGRPMAFTSHGCDQAGLGTHLLDAAQWLQRTGALSDFAVAWVPGQWWRV